MAEKGTKSWKDALLATSLPLEFLVAEKLGAARFFVTGEFPYTRLNEIGHEAEFSVDVECFELVETNGKTWGELRLLVECKYNHQSVKWVFAKHPNDEAVVLGVINDFQDLCTRRLGNQDSLFDFDRAIPFCFKGVELHAKDAHEKGIKHGLGQLRWAIPQLVANLIHSQISTLNDQDLNIGFVCPILLMNAPLYVLKSGVELATVRKADEIEEISDEVSSLIVYQERGPQLARHIRTIFQEVLSAGVSDRLREFWPLLHTDAERKFLDHKWDFTQSIDSIGTRVLVVNLDYFDQTLKEIRSAVHDAGKKLKRIANLDWSPETGAKITSS